MHVTASIDCRKFLNQDLETLYNIYTPVKTELKGVWKT